MALALPGSAQDDSACSDRQISASAVSSLGDVRAFVECASRYLEDHGPAEALRAFNEDARWKSGATYVFVLEIQASGETARRFVFPPDPSVQGQVRGASLDDFGTDLYAEIYRIMRRADSGWTYYSNPHPLTGNRSPKASYLIKVDWHGTPAVIGSGMYLADVPGTCHEEEVSAAHLTASPSPGTLRQFVSCASMLVQSQGYFAKRELENDQRWSDGSTYVFALDMMGSQVLSGNRLKVNGSPTHEWGRRSPGWDQFGGRDMIDVGHTFGESYLYYRAMNPKAVGLQGKIGFLKRTIASGVPVLVGAGYFHEPGQEQSVTACADHRVTAAAVQTASDLQAFVRCAAEYAMQHGESEARRAFNEDERWKSGPTYVFVDGIAPSGEDSLTHVFPPNPSREGSTWGTSYDSFGSDFFFELHRTLSVVDAGWVHYGFPNPVTGLREPKSSYVIAMDWNGDRAAIGAGLYTRDLPGTCHPRDVNAVDLESDPSDTKLREFVRCASYIAESDGYFAAPILSREPRWNHGSIYVFGVDAASGEVMFSSNPASFASSFRIPELLFEGRDVLEAARVFGEMFWYYDFTNPATGDLQRKNVFVRLVHTAQGPLLIGSGYNP